MLKPVRRRVTKTGGPSLSRVKNLYAERNPCSEPVWCRERPLRVKGQSSKVSEVSIQQKSVAFELDRIHLRFALINWSFLQFYIFYVSPKFCEYNPSLASKFWTYCQLTVFLGESSTYKVSRSRTAAMTHEKTVLLDPPSILSRNPYRALWPRNVVKKWNRTPSSQGFWWTV